MASLAQKMASAPLSSSSAAPVTPGRAVEVAVHDQPVDAEPGASHGPSIAGHPVFAGDRPARPGDVADAHPAERDEVGRGRIGRLLVVDVHVARGTVGATMPDQDGRQARCEQAVDDRILEGVRRDDHAVQEAHPEDVVEDLFLRPVAQPEHHPRALPGKVVRDPLQELGEVGVREQEVRIDVQDHADHARST